jgi:patatin-like phospholipase/acyl hydrolase
VTAVNRINNKDAIFKSTDAILNRDKDFYVKDIGRATSAAPTYFPSAEIKNLIASEKLSLVDGGMGMNNPSKLVIDEVKKMAFNSRNDKNYFLLSLGTGRLPS